MFDQQDALNAMSSAFEAKDLMDKLHSSIKEVAGIKGYTSDGTMKAETLCDLIDDITRKLELTAQRLNLINPKPEEKTDCSTCLVKSMMDCPEDESKCPLP